MKSKNSFEATEQSSLFNHSNFPCLWYKKDATKRKSIGRSNLRSKRGEQGGDLVLLFFHKLENHAKNPSSHRRSVLEAGFTTSLHASPSLSLLQNPPNIIKVSLKLAKEEGTFRMAPRGECCFLSVDPLNQL